MGTPDDRAIADELQPSDGQPDDAERSGGDCVEDSELAVLAERGVGPRSVGDSRTDGCLRPALRGAPRRGDRTMSTCALDVAA